MNKKRISLITALLFSLLFFKQHFGLNLLVFSIITTVLLMVTYPKRFKELKVLLFALSYLLSATVVFIYHTQLALITNLFSFFVLLGAVIQSKTSIYVQLLNGFYTTIASFFTITFQQFQEESSAVKRKQINYLYWLKMIGIPLIAVTVFVVLYRNANPYFNEVIQKIDLSFIDMQWILFTTLGYFLMFNILNPVMIESLTTADLETPNALTKNDKNNPSIESLYQENQLGVVLFIVLNGLLVFFLVTDVLYLSSISEAKAPDLSKAVHEGIYALITSIVFAISIILYFFRGDLNFFDKNKHLRFVTYAWIGLNVILAVITSYKNYLYVAQFGLTYKRIGVFIYLSLALVGLLTTFIKVHNIYNFWYILRKNIQVAYLLLVVSTVINWDSLITYYNIEEAKTTDLDYLINLSDNNTIALKNYIEAHSTKGIYTDKIRIEEKYQHYIERLKANSWQELVYDNIKILK